MKYIVNADDFGRTETVNKAIMESFQKGYISNTTIMVNMPFYDQALLLAKENDIMHRVGLHINVTSGKPLTDDICGCPTFVGKNGLFNGCVFKDRRGMAYLTKREKQAVALEVDAQIEKFLNAGFTQMHADSHGHIHTFPSLQKIIVREFKKYGFSSVRLPRNVGVSGHLKGLYKQIINFGFKSFNACTNYFGSMFDIWKQADTLNVQDGVTEIMLHPNYLNEKWDFGEPFSSDEIPKYITENMMSFQELID